FHFDSRLPRVLLWKALVDVAICSASGLRRVSHQDIPLVSSIESANSLNVPFVLNDFADDGSNATSLELFGMMEALTKLYSSYI
uniref:Uncharacterized protein n=1 Tax=Aegilops tauschii subsp. strangulata TaxID=200361 RepID=A0A453L0V9_AEGTS